MSRELVWRYGCPACGHMMTSHYEIGCALKAQCGCPVVVNWHGFVSRAALVASSPTTPQPPEVSV